MAGDIYLADTTVYVLQGRYPQVRRRFDALLTEGRLAACQMTALEYLNNAANPSSYESVWNGWSNGDHCKRSCHCGYRTAG